MHEREEFSRHHAYEVEDLAEVRDLARGLLQGIELGGEESTACERNNSNGWPPKNTATRPCNHTDLPHAARLTLERPPTVRDMGGGGIESAC